MSTLDDIVALDAEHVMQTYGRLPVAFVRGEGVRLWDSEGKEYLDFLGGLAVTSLGHAHPAVADAVAEQARTLLHVSNLYYNDVQPQGEGGVIPAPEGYLAAVRALCDEREALMIVDEVQAGLGRTGKWFGFQHADGVRPDIVTMAKALGNGVPIGACWARDEVASAFKAGDHATTFGGQPLAARAALTVLEVMEAEDVPSLATRAGERLTKALLALPGVAGVRGAGLLVGAELAPGIEAG